MEVEEGEKSAGKAESEEQVGEEEEEEEELKFVCVVCSKKFKSGKALGGHKRMHNNDNINNSDEKQKQWCSVCDKEFTSKKSLFGHMRSHPDRAWRGVRPPSPILTWSVTAKRGSNRPANARPRSIVVPGMDDADQEAVIDLMLLALRKRHKSCNHPFDLNHPPPPQYD